MSEFTENIDFTRPERRRIGSLIHRAGHLLFPSMESTVQRLAQDGGLHTHLYALGTPEEIDDLLEVKTGGNIVVLLVDETKLARFFALNVDGATREAGRQAARRLLPYLYGHHQLMISDDGTPLDDGVQEGARNHNYVEWAQLTPRGRFLVRLDQCPHYGIMTPATAEPRYIDEDEPPDLLLDRVYIAPRPPRPPGGTEHRYIRSPDSDNLF